MFINNTTLFVPVICSSVEMVWWIRWNWVSRWWAVVSWFHCLNLLHNCRRESLSEIDAREVCYGFDRLWLAVFYSCPPGGFLVRRSHGGWLHPWKWFRLLFKGKIKKKPVNDTPQSRSREVTFWSTREVVIASSPGGWSLAEFINETDLSSYNLFWLIFYRLLWNQMDDRRAETISWL